ncbi:hypothetical protein J1N35_043939, partial [Gossypium stocksii]
VDVVFSPRVVDVLELKFDCTYQNTPSSCFIPVTGTMSRHTKTYGYVTTPSACVVTLKAVSHFLYSALYVVTLDPPCCDIVSNINLKCPLMVSCTLT